MGFEHAMQIENQYIRSVVIFPKWVAALIPHISIPVFPYPVFS